MDEEMSEEPTPLREDPDAPVTLREDLRRCAQAAPAFDLAQGLSTLNRRLARGAGLGRWTWFALPVLLALGLGLTTFFARPGPDAHSPSIRPPTAPAAHPAQDDSTASESPPAARPPRTPPSAPPSIESPVHDNSVAVETARPRVEASPSSPTMQDEIAHMARLRAMASRDPEAALRMVREGSRRFRGGLFDEEREALRVLLLSDLHRQVRARRLGLRFLSRYPESAFASRIRELVAP